MIAWTKLVRKNVKNVVKTHKGEYGAGRFCCEKCARSFSSSEKRRERNVKTARTLQKWWKELKEERPEEYARIVQQRTKAFKAICANKKKHRKVVLYSTGEAPVHLNITYGELEEYRRNHPVCEICGRAERAKGKLVIDHDHETGEFRGLLCSSCNYKLGWHEGEAEHIRQYLMRGGRIGRVACL